MQYLCPNDGHELEPKTVHSGRVFSCPYCRGEMANVAMLRKDPHYEQGIADIWRQVLQTNNRNGAVCPICHEKMARVPIPGSGEKLDVCKPCQVVWLDRGEYDILPLQTWAEAAPREAPLSQEERLALMNMKLADLKEQYDDDNGLLGDLPQYINAADGVYKPGQADLDYEAPSLPIASWVMTGLMFIVFILFAATGFDLQTWNDMPLFHGRYGGFIQLVASLFLTPDLVCLLGFGALFYFTATKVEADQNRRYLLTLVGVTHVVGTLLALVANILFRVEGEFHTDVPYSHSLPIAQAYGPTWVLAALVVYYAYMYRDNPGRSIVYLGGWLLLQMYMMAVVSPDEPALAFIIPRLACLALGLGWAYICKYSEKFEK